MSGRFIVIEGIDGAGTSTQVKLLEERLNGAGIPAVSTAEPTGGPIGCVIRQALTHRLVFPRTGGSRGPSWATMALLFAADRVDHVESFIRPNLDDGVTVISDRYYLSSVAYQMTVSSNTDRQETAEWIRALNAMAERPDVIVVVDVDADVAARRRAARSNVIELYESDPLQARLAQVYRRAHELLPNDNVKYVNGIGTPTEVCDRILKKVGLEK